MLVKMLDYFLGELPILALKLVPLHLLNCVDAMNERIRSSWRET